MVRVSRQCSGAPCQHCKQCPVSSSSAFVMSPLPALEAVRSVHIGRDDERARLETLPPVASLAPGSWSSDRHQRAEPR